MLRRKKLGEFFFDVAKFAVIVGIIGRFISDDIDIKAFGLILWFILPKSGGDE